MSKTSGAKYFFRRFLPVLVVLLLCAFGCSSKGQELVGMWNNTNVPETMEFRADKTGVITAVDKHKMDFTWQLNSKNNFSININYGGQKTAVNAILQDNTLVLEMNAVKETYRKKP